ncbi:hypothetical protein [Sphingomonas sp. 22176]|uniref:hypothetical protein n=1 Tax=Sphingomonas sp. 22176 TaxID=3453884 RepID=UPI003F8774E6
MTGGGWFIAARRRVKRQKTRTATRALAKRTIAHFRKVTNKFFRRLMKAKRIKDIQFSE